MLDHALSFNHKLHRPEKMILTVLLPKGEKINEKPARRKLEPAGFTAEASEETVQWLLGCIGADPAR
jgi:hypothetical protein